MCIANVLDGRHGKFSVLPMSIKRMDWKLYHHQFRTQHQTVSNGTMKSKIASILMLAVAAQAQFIDSYAGYPLPTATQVQWLPQGQLFPSNLNAYPLQSYYRDISSHPVNSYYNPIAQVDANAVQAGATVYPKSSIGPIRKKRQILLRYRNAAARRGRSVNKLSSLPAAQFNGALVRHKRQIQLLQRNAAARRGRSVKKLSSLPTAKFNGAPVRHKRQILLRYRNSGRRRIGRSLNERSLTGAMPTH